MALYHNSCHKVGFKAFISAKQLMKNDTWSNFTEDQRTDQVGQALQVFGDEKFLG